MSHYSVGRVAAGAVIGWYCTFVVIFICWVVSEQAEPGQQYADPLLPSLFCGFIFGVIPGILVAGLTARRR